MNTEITKIPPQAIDLEEAVLGAILIEAKVMPLVSEILDYEDFYNPKHQVLYKTMREMYLKNFPIDILSVGQYLKSKDEEEKAGGVYYINELTNKVASSANTLHHCLIIKQKSIKRKSIMLFHESYNKCYDEVTDIFQLIDDVSYELSKINTINFGKIKSTKQVGEKIKKNIVQGVAIGKIYKVGLADMEFVSKTFNVLAGMQGTGKTAMTLTIARMLSAKGYKVGINSMEMSNEMLCSRLFQQETMISSKKIISNELSDKEKEEILNIELDKNIFVDEETNINSQNIIGKIKSFKMKYNIDVLFIDFLQMIALNGKNQNEVRKIELMAKGLQNIAKSLDIAIIGLSQLRRVDKEPSVNDLRNGGLEQSASNIYILYDEFYSENLSKKWNEIDEAIRGRIKVIDGKNRYDENQSNYVYFNKPLQRFEDIGDLEPKDYEEIF